MSEVLLDCPFCAAGTTQVKENTFWTGMRSQVTSVDVMHWCESAAFQNVLKVRGKTREEAINKWNTRVAP